ncbi:transporter [Pontibacter diazotrophicus]|uniref:Transporter n=1 Tax=Pontibacter diazotrophicus TaxID=1400979 RepID=A0A3D8LEN4_9BACT|nr:transporter [Pontibacter diazotrophicus]RDV15891.1 transporter [Pontibacter diazotrophicus]
MDRIYTQLTSQFRWLLVVVALLAFVQPAHCQDEEVPEFETDRPDQAEAASLVPRGTLQLETGFFLQEDTEMGVEQKIRAYPTALVRLGVLNWLELRVQSALRDSVMERRTRFRTSGFAPLTLGAKVKLWDEQGLRPQAALMTMVTLPIGSRAFRPENPDPNFRALFKNSLTDNLALSYNLVYGWVGGDPVKGYAVSLGYDITDKLTAFGEVYGDKQKGEEAEHAVDGGLMYMLLPNLQLDVAAGRALNDAAPDYYFTAGFSWRIPR